jgi:hypothetical protein
MNQALALFLCHFPLPFDRGRLGLQAQKFPLSHIRSLAHGHKLTL